MARLTNSETSFSNDDCSSNYEHVVKTTVDSCSNSTQSTWIENTIKKATPPIIKEAVLFPIVNSRRVGRNEKCLCGSGKKFKACCLKKL